MSEWEREEREGERISDMEIEERRGEEEERVSE